MPLMPVFATQIFHGGPHTLGLLMTTSGCGALVGALWLAARRSVIGLGRVIAYAAAAFGVGLVAFSFAPVLLTGQGERSQWARAVGLSLSPRACYNRGRGGSRPPRPARHHGLRSGDRTGAAGPGHVHRRVGRRVRCIPARIAR